MATNSNDLFPSGSAMDDFFSQADNYTNVLPPEVGDPSPMLESAAAPVPSTDIPAPGTPAAYSGPDTPAAPGYGPIVPDTTQGVTAEDSPGQLFTEENMGADRSADFLQGYADKAPGVTPEQTVQGQLEQILNKDNALFDWARGQAAQYANSRGLLNSDIAAEASSQAVMGVALPIAEHDANVYAQRAAQERQFWYTAGLQAFDATIQSGLMAQDHMQQMVELSHQGDINSRLQLEQFGYNWQLSVQDNLHQMQQIALQGDINAELALQQFGFDTELMRQDFGYRVRLADIDLKNSLSLSAQDNEQWIERMGIEHVNTLAEIAAQGDISRDINTDNFSNNLQMQYMDRVGQRTSELNAEIERINSTEGLTPAQQRNAVNQAIRRYESDLAMYAEMFSSNPSWDPNWEVSSYSGDAGGSFIPTDNTTDPTPTPIPEPTPEREREREREWDRDRESGRRTHD